MPEQTALHVPTGPRIQIDCSFDRAMRYVTLQFPHALFGYLASQRSYRFRQLRGDWAASYVDRTGRRVSADSDFVSLLGEELGNAITLALDDIASRVRYVDIIEDEIMLWLTPRAALSDRSTGFVIGRMLTHLADTTSGSSRFVGCSVRHSLAPEQVAIVALAAENRHLELTCA